MKKQKHIFTKITDDRGYIRVLIDGKDWMTAEEELMKELVGDDRIELSNYSSFFPNSVLETGKEKMGSFIFKGHKKKLPMRVINTDDEAEEILNAVQKNVKIVQDWIREYIEEPKVENVSFFTF